jgi:hypothetical protein
MRKIAELAGKYPRETLTVIGRGPSLALLQLKHLEGPVVAINQAVTVVEALDYPGPCYSMQKDHAYVKTRYPILYHIHESGKEAKGRKVDFIFDNEADFGLPWNVPSVETAVALAKLMGCPGVKFLCCDAMSHGNILTFEAGRAVKAPHWQHYLLHRRMVTARAKELALPVEFMRI